MTLIYSKITFVLDCYCCYFLIAVLLITELNVRVCNCIVTFLKEHISTNMTETEYFIS